MRAHEVYATLGKVFYTDGCSTQETGHYLDDENPDDLANYVRGLVADRVESLIEANILLYGEGPRHDVMLNAVANILPNPTPTVGDCNAVLGWVRQRPGSPVRLVQVQGERFYRYVLVHEEVHT